MFTDCMVDIESTGTDPGNNAIIQIAAIQFNFDTEEIGPVFNRCLSMAPRRYWEESTRTWWGIQNKAVFDSIIDRMEPPEQVMRDLVTYASTGAPNGGFRMWAKPISFDFAFIASYCFQYGLPSPFHFRIGRDLNTYIAAQAGGAEHVDMPHIATPNAHDALADCVHQLKMLFSAKAKDFGDVYTDFTEVE